MKSFSIPFFALLWFFLLLVAEPAFAGQATNPFGQTSAASGTTSANLEANKAKDAQKRLRRGLILAGISLGIVLIGSGLVFGSIFGGLVIPRAFQILIGAGAIFAAIAGGIGLDIAINEWKTTKDQPHQKRRKKAKRLLGLSIGALVGLVVSASIGFLTVLDRAGFL